MALGGSNRRSVMRTQLVKIMSEQDQADIDELSKQLKGFDNQVSTAEAHEDAPPADAPPAEQTQDQKDVAKLQASLGIVPMAADPCATCDNKSCTVRGMGMTSINCKTTTYVGPGGILKTVDR